MKKYVIYLLILILGIVAGGYFFSNSKENTSAHPPINASINQEMWTCSMHPQIMQPEPGDCPICGMELIPAETGQDGLAAGQFTMTANALALANVQTMVIGATSTNVSGTINLSGNIAVNEEAIAVQASYFDGRIEKLHVNYEGQDMGKGELLASIYAPELVAAQQELLTAASLKGSQPQLYQAVRNKLKLWKLTEKQIDGIESSGKVTESFPVYATVSGTVSEVMSAEGDYVKKGQPIVKLSDLSTVWAEFDAYESQLSVFKKGQNIRITTNAYPNKSFDGKIAFIDPILDNATRTVTVRATLKNEEDIFKPGMFVSGAIEGIHGGESETELLVPTSAIMWTGERSLVYVKVKKDEPVFEMREVMLGTRIGEQIQVTSGLEAGEEIVTNGTFTVDAAAQLQGKRSMMNKLGGKSMTGHEGHAGMQQNMVLNNHNAMMPMKFSESFEKNFKEVLPIYFRLKDALVAGNTERSSLEAKAMKDALQNIDNSELGNMEKDRFGKITEMIKAITVNQDIENQRSHFVILNENMVAIASSFNSFEKTLYIQQCPMANSNRGAVWLSMDKDIKNPYFGDAMLTCGAVIDSLK
ncbi:efflux RND transporter periplasmic adaptor subunit [Maribacter aurantiacus]|uniref:Efflux RND transporter periplasmic adaptor subunit n=1 Tax=Maribacter aurantiacus TaxID=1882343 RepID=A0A5R8M4Z6_9FLAO|nr:efflux RND transporter periplasmic adaptor subunit [Maribacter aurantiacus]TLF44575.1 efflux RND transporter periplasmic adaptor subunit [Maribacter aurantiacus]